MCERQLRITGNRLAQQTGGLCEAVLAPAFQTQYRVPLPIQCPGAQIHRPPLA